jgi:sec-independent protein translocase protein TatA
MQLPLAFQMPGFGEMLLIAAIGLLIFGKRLPEVGKSLGKGIVEFKKGLKGIEDDVEAASSQPAARPQLQQPMYQQQQPVAPPPYKFDPYTGKPIEQNASATSTPPGTA